MGIRPHLQKQASSQSTFTPVTNPFQSRPFAPPKEVSPQQQETPDLQAQQEKPKGFGYNLGKISITNRNGVGQLPIQTKLTIGQPGDKYEQEADRVASEVVQRLHAPKPLSFATEQSVQRQQMPEEDELQMKPLTKIIQRQQMPEEDELQMKPLTKIIQRQQMPEEDELQMKPAIQQKAGAGGMNASANLESGINQARSGGQLLADNIRQPMEQAFGADFSSVRVHTDTRSDMLNRSINARAFTTKNDIFFKQGEYNPGSKQGQELLAHELTHVVQQSGGNTIQRKTMNIPEIPDEYVRTRVIGSSKTEDIKQGIGKYNQIEIKDTNYPKQIEILEKIEGKQIDWAKKHNSNISKKDIKRLKSDPFATLGVDIDSSDDPERFEFMCGLINLTNDELLAVIDQRDQDLASQASNPQSQTQQGGLRGFVKGLYNENKQMEEENSDLKDADEGQKEVREAGETLYDGFKTLLTDFDNASQQAQQEAQKVFTGEIGFLGIINQIKKAIDYFGITDLLKSIYTAYTSYKDMNALKAATQGAETSRNEQLKEATKYGYEKVWRQFWTSAVPKVVRNIMQTASRIVAFVTGGISLIVDLGQKVLGAVDTLYRKGKGFWKWLTDKRGVNRNKNAETIVNSALGGDRTARDLLLTLDLFSMKDKVIMKVLDGTNLNEIPGSDLNETNRTRLLYLLTKMKNNNQLKDFNDKVSEKLKSFVG